jgi:hypothetical protein
MIKVTAIQTGMGQTTLNRKTSDFGTFGQYTESDDPEQLKSDMSLKFTAGDLTIHRLIEVETTFLPAHDIFAGLTPDLLAENRQWLRDSGAMMDATDTLILCFQCYVVRSPHYTILIDSCIGNDELRSQSPNGVRRPTTPICAR